MATSFEPSRYAVGGTIAAQLSLRAPRAAKPRVVVTIRPLIAIASGIPAGLVVIGEAVAPPFGSVATPVGVAGAPPVTVLSIRPASWQRHSGATGSTFSNRFGATSVARGVVAGNSSKSVTGLPIRSLRGPFS